MRYSELSMPLASGGPSLLRQSRFWIVQLAGWLVAIVLYFRDSIQAGFVEGDPPLTIALTATCWGLAVACSSALAAAYLRMPPRWLTGIRAIPVALGLSLLAALPWGTVITWMHEPSMQWLQVGYRYFFHGSVLMMAWSGAFLWFMRGEGALKTQVPVLRPEALAPEAKVLDLGRAEALAQGASPGSAPEVPAASWRPDERVALEERNHVRFCLVRDIAYVRANGDYTEVRLSSGHAAFVTQPLRYWESRLPESFVRIHRSTLINLGVTEELEHVGGAWQVRLRGCQEPLAVSRRLAHAVKAKAIGQKG